MCVAEMREALWTMRRAHRSCLHRAYSRPVIDLGTLAGLREHSHELQAYCLACNRWATVDLDALISGGFGWRRLPITVRCHVCRAIGQLQVRPPAPTCTSTNGWMEPN